MGFLTDLFDLNDDGHLSPEEATLGMMVAEELCDTDEQEDDFEEDEEDF